MTNRDFLVVTTTHDDESKARDLASALVRDRLAACAQVYAVRSVYWWDGEVRDSAEWRIDLKTRAELAERLAARIAELHSYDTPEVVGVPVVTGSTAYLDWVDAETTQDR
ncbi:divalent-cation tolerance protein CutA [Streptomyces sp. NRRL S-350]|uniref:divalent-cation tolerance protein CutA n=1 Tax=Streptomyces sp. NRRL S-350 TaxID=1463902 RepID=UPI0004C1C2C8|nr:divalent-cation tolerance protein CutA [Streptomyces sp. NRRL S-350]